MINKYIFYFIFFILLQQNIHTQPQQLLKNTFIYDVQFDYQQNILCIGTYLIVTYPKVTQKLNQNLEYLWPNNEYGVLLTNPTGQDETGGGIMLPQDDGSVIYYFSYDKYLGAFNFGDSLNPFIEYLYTRYPSVQKVDADGNVLWGENGIKLSNQKAVYDLMAPLVLLNMSHDSNGNIVFFWAPSFAENEKRTEEFKGTFMQKIDPASGELLYDSTGKKITDYDISYLREWGDNNLFFKEKGELCNIDKDGNILWVINLTEEYNIFKTYTLATSQGDLFLLYEEEPGTIKNAYIESNGNIQFNNQIIFPQKLRLNRFATCIEWEEDKWIYAFDEHLYYFSCDGVQFWDTSGVHIHPPLYGIGFADIKALNNDKLLILYTTIMDSGSYDRVLKMQIISKDGSFVLGEEGVDLMENSGPGHILPDNNGGAYIVANVHSIYEPEYRPRGSYILRIDANGNIITRVPINLSHSNDIPDDFILVKNYPNPFSEYTNFIIQNSSHLHDKPHKLIIYNILGKEVRSYDISNKKLENRFEFNWDGKDHYGKRVSPGVYFYNLIATDYSTIANGKLILIK
jgi:hypothetical protein